MLKERYPLYLANRPVSTSDEMVVVDKYSGFTATRVAVADRAMVESAITSASAAVTPMRRFPPHARKAVLEHCVRRFRERAEELALALCVEAGKPIRDARGEVTRLIDTFQVAAEESVRVDGEVLTLAISPRAEGYRGFTRRVPI
ncbi:MAG TPA: aldehyde dehydrogenase family protein, partial [Gaiellaceae bacterium]|nr:aldehyde dehydrogenase family protein [Gaiellaceae bacterium]